MKRKLSGIAYLCLLLVGMVASLQARAEYGYTLVHCPGAVTTQLWGINNQGLIIGQASFADSFVGPYFDFTYDPAKGVFTLIPDVPGYAETGAIGVNEKGTLVGTTSPDWVAASPLGHARTGTDERPKRSLGGPASCQYAGNLATRPITARPNLDSGATDSGRTSKPGTPLVPSLSG